MTTREIYNGRGVGSTIVTAVDSSVVPKHSKVAMARMSVPSLLCEEKCVHCVSECME